MTSALVSRRRPPALEALEPRVLFSADPAGLAAGFAGGAPAADPAWVAPVTVEARQADRQAPADATLAVAPRELVVVDARIPDAARLIADLHAQRADGRDLDLLLVDADTDGLAALGEALAAADRPYDAVHLLGHGVAGAMQLGSATLGLDTLRQRAGEIAAWSAGLDQRADLLLWGCDTGAGTEGRALVDGLAALTGADVAASSDATGGALAGGNWQLEVVQGEIQASAPIGGALQVGFAGLLALPGPDVGGGDVQVNTTLAGTQALPDQGGGRSLATSAGGTSVVTWVDQASGQVLFRRFDADGSALGPQTLVSDDGAPKAAPAVAIDAAGGFVIVWERTSDGTLHLRRFDAGGSALDASVQLDTGLSGAASRPSIAMSASGAFVVAWQVDAQNAFGEELRARRFSAAGVAQGSILEPATTTLGDQVAPTLAMHADGSFAVAWVGPAGPGVANDPAGWIRMYDPNGSPLQGSGLRVTPGGHVPANLDLAADLSGRYLLAWDAELSGQRQIHGRIVYTDGTETGVPRFDDRPSGNQSAPSIATTPSGRFTVAWTDAGGDGDGAGIRARNFSADGSAQGASQVVNRHTEGNQERPTAGHVGGTLHVVWSGTSALDGAGVVLRALPSGFPGVSVTRNGDTTNESGSVVSTFGVRLDAAPAHAVTVALAVSDPLEGRLSQSVLTFDAANWHLAQTVTVSGVDDWVIDGDRAFQVTGSVTSADPAFVGALVPLNFVNIDDDTRNTVVVNTTADTVDGNTTSLAGLWRDRGSDGLISLREAILAANATPNGEGGVDRIIFDLPGTGVGTIWLSTALPAITQAIEIDGHAGPDWGGTTPVIELRRAIGAPNFDGLRLADGSSGSIIRGLAVGGMHGSGIRVLTSGNVIEHNHLGTDASGTVAQANRQDGLLIRGGAGNVVRSNLVSGNLESGIELRDGATGNLIASNRIGTDAAGTAALGNRTNGVFLDEGAANNRIVDNVIAGNQAVLLPGATIPGAGVRLQDDGTSGNEVTANFIGTDRSGTVALGNGAYGVLVLRGASNNAIGGPGAADGNLIAHHDRAGVRVLDQAGSSRGNAITANRFVGNAQGIDLAVVLGDPVAVTPNDPGDTDVGGNGLQNFPVLSQARPGADRAVVVAGMLDAAPLTTFRIDVYADDTPSAEGHGDGAWWLGSFELSTDAAGRATFEQVVDPAADPVAASRLAVPLPAGTAISATATRVATGGVLADTSEFGPNVALNAPPSINTPVALFVPENTARVATLTASDPDTPAGSLVWTIEGGPDAARFEIDGNVLRFRDAPDFELPADADVDNVYEVDVGVSDGIAADTRRLSVTVTDVDEVLAITHPTEVSVAENTTTAIALTATDLGIAAESLVWTIEGGPDAARFEIEAGALRFVAAPDFEAPTDADRDNVYEVDVRVSDGTQDDTRRHRVTVTNVNEAPTLVNWLDRQLPEGRLAVATLRGIDPETPSGSLTFSIVDDPATDGVHFEIVGGDQLRLRAPLAVATPLDRDGDNVYEVRIAVSDGALTTEARLSVTLLEGGPALVPASSAVTVGTPSAVTGSGEQRTNDTGGRAVALTPDGNTVVVWTDTRTGVAQVWGSVHDAAGDPLVAPRRLDSDGTQGASQPALAIDAQGRIAVVWTAEVEGSREVRMRVWDANAAPLGGEITVNTVTAGDQDQPAIAAVPGGGWVVTWTQGNADGSDQPILMRRLDEAGAPVGAPVEITWEALDTRRGHSAVGVAADGTVVVAYASDSDGGSGTDGGFGVFVRVVEADGSFRTSWVRVNDTVAGAQVQPELSVAADGGFVVVWTDRPGGAGLLGAGVRARAFDANAVPRTGELTLDSTHVGDQDSPTVAMLADGGFVAAWESVGQDAPGSEGIVLRRFAADGTPLTGEIVANTWTEGDQVRPSLAAAGDRIVLVWSGAVADGLDGVSLRHFAMPAAGFTVTPVTAGPAGLTLAEDGGTVAFDVVATAPPAGTLVLTVSLPPGAGAALTVSAGELRFDAGNWNVAQRLVVTGVPDTLASGDRVFVLTLTPGGSDPAFAALEPVSHEITRLDDDDRNEVVVDTIDDLVDGDTSSLAALLSSRGADGRVSLREALLAANATANGPGGADRVLFDLPGDGAQTIRLGSALPEIIDPIEIDGAADPEHAGTPVVVLTAAEGLEPFDGLVLGEGSDGSLIAGLAIGGFAGDGLVVRSDDNRIVGNHLGVDAAGVTAFGNQGRGLLLTGDASGNEVRDNVIGANRGGGVLITGPGADFNRIQSNAIGTDAAGVLALGNALSGIAITDGASGNLIGGPDDGEGNRIRGNDQRGVHVYGDARTSDNAILRNLIDGHALGIDLSDRFRPRPLVTANDPGDLDGGGNRQQNFPVLILASPDGSLTRVTVRLDSEASSTYRIDFYADPAFGPDATGSAEGVNWMGQRLVTTDASGRVEWTQSLAGLPYAAGVTATATRTDAAGLVLGDTSEFSATIRVNTTPIHTGANRLSVAEGRTEVGTLTATDADTGPDSLTWSISGGADGALFRIDPSTGVLSFVAAPDFERPADADRNNVYDVHTRVTDPLGRGNNRVNVITVTDVNEAPVVQAPAALTLAEDTPFTLSAATGTALSVTDPDTTGAPLRVQIEVDRGTLTLADTRGLSFDAGDGRQDRLLRFSGSPADIAAALAAVLYEPEPDHHGRVTLTLSAVDAGDPLLAAAATVALTIEPVNDAPVLEVTPSERIRVPGERVLPLESDRLRATDVDHGADAIDYTLEQAPAAGALLRDGVPLVVGGRFTQADVDAGLIAFRAPAHGGPQELRLTVADRAGAAAVGGPVLLRLMVDAAGGGAAAAVAPGAASPGAGAGEAAAAADAADVAGAPADAGSDGAGAPAAGRAAAAGGSAALSATALGQGTGAQAIGGRSEQFPAIGGLRDAAGSGLPTGTPSLAAFVPPYEPLREAAGRPEPWQLSDPFARVGPNPTLELHDTATRAWSPVVALRQADFRQELAQARDEVTRRFEARGALVASSVAITTSLSIGYVVWLLRGGVLLTSLLASMPAWRSIDPLPVLARMDARGRDDETEDDSLRGLLKRAADRQSEAAQAAERGPAQPATAAAGSAA